MGCFVEWMFKVFGVAAFLTAGMCVLYYLRDHFGELRAAAQVSNSYGDYITYIQYLFGVCLFGLGLCVLWVYFLIRKKVKKIATNLSEAESLQKAKELLAANEARKDWLMVTCPTIVQKLNSTGFSSLDQKEKRGLFKLSDQVGSNLENLHENEAKVLEVAFSNQGVYNMLQMRSNQLQPNNQAALKNLKTIKTASMFSGVNAAREMGESFSE